MNEIMNEELLKLVLDNEKLFKVGRMTPEDESFEFFALDLHRVYHKKCFNKLGPNYTFVKLTDQEFKQLFDTVSKMVNNKAFL